MLAPRLLAERRQVGLLLEPVTAVDRERLTRDVGGKWRAERRGPDRDLLGCCEPSQRHGRRHARPIFLTRPERLPRAFRIGGPGTDAVHTDPVLRPFHG